MAKPKPLQIQRVTSRPGEGARLAVTDTRKEPGGGSSISVDLMNAPVPERRYVADQAAVIRASGGGFRLVFAQSKLGVTDASDGTLRSMLDVQMSERGARQFLDSLVRVREPLNRLDVQPMGLITDFAEPPQAVGLAANMVPMAFSGPECCLDFYNLSPFGMPTEGGEPPTDVFAEPVVRVMLPTSLFVSIMLSLEKSLAGPVKPNSLPALEEMR